MTRQPRTEGCASKPSLSACVVGIGRWSAEHPRSAVSRSPSLPSHRRSRRSMCRQPSAHGVSASHLGRPPTRGAYAPTARGCAGCRVLRWPLSNGMARHETSSMAHARPRALRGACIGPDRLQVHRQGRPHHVDQRGLQGVGETGGCRLRPAGATPGRMCAHKNRAARKSRNGAKGRRHVATPKVSDGPPALNAQAQATRPVAAAARCRSTTSPVPRSSRRAAPRPRSAS